MPIGVYSRKSVSVRFSEATRPAGDCVEWVRYSDRKGYGRMWVEGRDRRATHVAWYLHTGAWPDRQMLHTCDNPACVSVRHLFLGTIQDNMRDKCEKSRQARGEKNGNRKLTDEQVRWVRATQLRPSEVARVLGVDKSLVWLIRSRKIWRHI